MTFQCMYDIDIDLYLIGGKRQVMRCRKRMDTNAAKSKSSFYGDGKRSHKELRSVCFAVSSECQNLTVSHRDIYYTDDSD